MKFCSAFRMGQFAKLANGFRLLTIFIKRFVLHDVQSLESAFTLLVFCNYLFVIVITAIFILCSHQLLVQTHRNTFRTALYGVVLLTLRGKARQVNLFRYCWPFSYQCFSLVEASQLICVANQQTGCCMRLTLPCKRISIYPYYLIIVNLLFFNCRFIMFLLRTLLESNQVLAYVFKNIKIKHFFEM